MKATTEEADGSLTLLEDRLMQGKTTRLHSPPNPDETMIVLEGAGPCTRRRDRASARPPWGCGGPARLSARARGHLGERADSKAADARKRRGLPQG